MAINGRTKGASGEREAAKLLESWTKEWGYDFELERNLEQSRGGGHDLTGMPLSIEVKRVETNGINSWWEQCLRQAAKANLHPLLMHRRNRQPWRFRTIAKASFYGAAPAAYSLVVDLELDEFKKWLWAFLHHHRLGG